MTYNVLYGSHLWVSIGGTKPGLGNPAKMVTEFQEVLRYKYAKFQKLGHKCQVDTNSCLAISISQNLTKKIIESQDQKVLFFPQLACNFRQPGRMMMFQNLEKFEMALSGYQTLKILGQHIEDDLSLLFQHNQFYFLNLFMLTLRDKFHCTKLLVLSLYEKSIAQSFQYCPYMVNLIAHSADFIKKAICTFFFILQCKGVGVILVK